MKAIRAVLFFLAATFVVIFLGTNNFLFDREVASPKSALRRGTTSTTSKDTPVFVTTSQKGLATAAPIFGSGSEGVKGSPVGVTSKPPFPKIDESDDDPNADKSVHSRKAAFAGDTHVGPEDEYYAGAFTGVHDGQQNAHAGGLEDKLTEDGSERRGFESPIVSFAGHGHPVGPEDGTGVFSGVHDGQQNERGRGLEAKLAL